MVDLAKVNLHASIYQIQVTTVINFAGKASFNVCQINKSLVAWNIDCIQSHNFYENVPIQGHATDTPLPCSNGKARRLQVDSVQTRDNPRDKTRKLFSTTTMQSPRRTRQPLSEIVLDPKKALKRPLSPSSILLTPSKRRLLAAEDFPISPNRVPKHTSARILPPCSPTPKATSGQVARPSRDKYHASTKSSPPVFSKCNVAQGEHHPASPTSPFLVPRELPSTADRQSAHWPGFDVHCDAYMSIPISTSKFLNQAVTNEESDSEKFKENVKPRPVTSKRQDTKDINPSENDRPTSKMFSPPPIFSNIQSNADEEAAVDQLL